MKNTRNNYEKSIQGKLSTQFEEDMEINWNKIKSFVNKAAKENMRQETRQKASEWYNVDCRNIIQRRK